MSSPKKTKDKENKTADGGHTNHKAAGDGRNDQTPGPNEKQTANHEYLKRKRVELLGQIKYTLIYDERVDREPVQ